MALTATSVVSRRVCKTLELGCGDVAVIGGGIPENVSARIFHWKAQSFLAVMPASWLAESGAGGGRFVDDDGFISASVWKMAVLIFSMRIVEGLFPTGR